MDSLAAVDSLPSSPEVSIDRRHGQQSGKTVGRHWWDDDEEIGERRSFLKPVREKELEEVRRWWKWHLFVSHFSVG